MNEPFSRMSLLLTCGIREIRSAGSVMLADACGGSKSLMVRKADEQNCREEVPGFPHEDIAEGVFAEVVLGEEGINLHQIRTVGLLAGALSLAAYNAGVALQ